MAGRTLYATPHIHDSMNITWLKQHSWLGIHCMWSGTFMHCLTLHANTSIHAYGYITCSHSHSAV